MVNQDSYMRSNIMRVDGFAENLKTETEMKMLDTNSKTKGRFSVIEDL